MASGLENLLQEYLGQRINQSNQSEYTRLVLGGIPLTTLRDLFDLLTNGTGCEWEPADGLRIPVFLVAREPRSCEAGPSQECNWDYAISARNSFSSFLILVDPAVWDERPYSITNATETVGSPLPPVRGIVSNLRNWSAFYADIVETSAEKIGLRFSVVESAIRQALRELPSLDPDQQHRLPWEVLERIVDLANEDHQVTNNHLALKCGIPPTEHNVDDFRGSRRVLERLSGFLEDAGIDEGVLGLQATSRGSGLVDELSAMGSYLRSSAGSASGFVRAPCFYYASPGSQVGWQSTLTAEVFTEMLADMGRRPDPDKLSISCTNALNTMRSPGEPVLVQTKVALDAKHPEGAFQSLQISRKIGRRDSESLASLGVCQSPVSLEDQSPPTHQTPITYTAEDFSATSASVQVISLVSYGPGAFVTCHGNSTRRITRPRRSRVTAPWQQQFHFRSSGSKTLEVFCKPGIDKIRVMDPPEFVSEHQVSGGKARLPVLLDEDVEITLRLVNAADELISTFSLGFAIDQDEQDTIPSQFDALIQTHQQVSSSIPTARSRDSWLRQLEEQLLTHDSSWKPILALPGWSSSPPVITDIRVLGNTQLQSDPRQVLDPPPDFLEARKNVLEHLAGLTVPVPEADLANETVKQLVAEYLRTYREWAEVAPAEACWLDTIAILETNPDRYGDQVFASHEPVAVLVSPLHPVRLGWHTAAQDLLLSSVDAPCPLAGLLDPHRCPDVFPLALTSGGDEPHWKSFVAISCQDAFWGLFWDAGRLRDIQQHETVPELSRAGAAPRGIQSGFTASQAGRTLEEIRHVMPTRAVLRIGIVSSVQGSTSCTDGVFQWSRQKYNSETGAYASPSSIEVYDSRRQDSQPSREDISSLAADTGHHLRWFTRSVSAPVKDLVIIDHLGLANPSMENLDWKSPATEGNLIRSRIRTDRNDAEWVVESRAAHLVRSEDPLLDELSMAIWNLEKLAEDQGGCSHIAFMPNREVLRGELQGTRFLAVSSAEIDPACFARGTPEAGGFLWDYELPQAVGPGEQRGGFYLLAKPPEAIKQAVMAATRVVSNSDLDIEALLTETSRRGIPILKRLAAGGTMARGELGMLLAVRLLQDSFRGPGRQIRLPVCEGNTVRMVLPVDPYVSPLNQLRKGLNEANAALDQSTRPDLLLASLQIDPDEGTQVHLVPLEVKFREGVMSAADKTASLAQASSLGDTLHHLLRATPVSRLWELCGRGFLAEILDHGFRVYGDPQVTGHSPEEWVKIHQACLADVLNGRVRVSIAQEGRLLIFDESSSSHFEDVDEDGFDETLVVSRADSRALLEDGVLSSTAIDQVANTLDLCGSPVTTQSSTPQEDPGERYSTENESDPSDTSPQNPCDITSPVVSNSGSTAVPSTTREYVAGVFSNFVGNRAAVDTLKRGILKALLSAPPQLPASYLFTGNPSTGKTEIARRVASALALPFVSLDGRGLRSRERLFELIDAKLLDEGQQANQVGIQYQKPELEYPPLVVFIDEVHLVPKAVQESLLTALERKDRSVLLNDRVARIPSVTFLLATTRPSEVDAAFRTRCTEIPLQDYTEEEVAAIVGLEHLEWDEQLRRRVARYGRLVPRLALELARDLSDEALVSEYQDRDMAEHLEEVRRTRLIDDNGLGPADMEYLELLDREGRPLGETNILTMLPNIDKDRVLEEVEPLLVARMKLVRRTSKGREITQEGRRYVIDLRKSGLMGS